MYTGKSPALPPLLLLFLLPASSRERARSAARSPRGLYTESSKTIKTRGKNSPPEFFTVAPMRPSRRERLCKNVDCGYSGHEARPFGRRITAGPPCPCPVRLVTKAAWPRQASSRVHCNRPGAASYPNIIQSLADRLSCPLWGTHFGLLLWHQIGASHSARGSCTLSSLPLQLYSPSATLQTLQGLQSWAVCTRNFAVSTVTEGTRASVREALSRNGRRRGPTEAKRQRLSRRTASFSMTHRSRKKSGRRF